MQHVRMLAALVLVAGCQKAEPAAAPRPDAYKDLILRDKPLAYWPLDEQQGETARDLSGNERHGTYKNKVKLGQRGTSEARLAPDFDGGLVELAQKSVFTTIPGDFTIEAWLSVRSFAVADVGCGNAVYGNDTILAFGKPKEFECGVAAPAGLFYLSIRGRTVYSNVYGPGPVPKWLHVAFSRAGSTYQIYVNGELNTSGPIAPVPIEITGVMRQLGLGYSGENSSPFLGGLQDIAVYDKALTAEQVRARVQAMAEAAGPATLVDDLKRWLHRDSG